MDTFGQYHAFVVCCGRADVCGLLCAQWRGHVIYIVGVHRVERGYDVLVTAGTFGAMSVVGFTIKKDLSAFGRLLIMVLFGLIIATVVNMFVASSTLDWALTYIGVFLFAV